MVDHDLMEHIQAQFTRLFLVKIFHVSDLHNNTTFLLPFLPRPLPFAAEQFIDN
jgi:hypothetical protein